MVSEVDGKKSSVLLIGAAWLLVAVPAGWGLSYTLQNAMKLFVKQSPAVTAPGSK